MLSHPSIGIGSLFCLKNIGEMGAARETRYCIECKGQDPIKMEGVETLEGSQRQRNLPFLLEGTKAGRVQNVLHKAVNCSFYCVAS
jgi:hypothetical protein